jgi:hypothetical protein
MMGETRPVEDVAEAAEALIKEGREGGRKGGREGGREEGREGGRER